MLNVCLCDDSKAALDEYTARLAVISKQENLELKMTCYESGEQLLFESEEKLNGFDIVYLDMLMGKLNGIDTAKALREAGFSGQVIFLTSSKDYMLEAFDAMPLHYIVKQETDDAKFKQVFMKAVNIAALRQNESFAFETHGQVTRVELDDILYFEVQIRQVYLYSLTEQYCFYSKMDVVEKQLSGKNFSRCHRSFVVNLRHIRSINNAEIILTNGKSVPVGNTYFKTLKADFSAYLQSKAVII